MPLLPMDLKSALCAYLSISILHYNVLCTKLLAKRRAHARTISCFLNNLLAG